MHTPAALLQLLVAALRHSTDASDDTLDTDPGEAPDEHGCLADRACSDVIRIDASAIAVRAKYRGGALRGIPKRTAFRPVALRSRRVVLMVHQTGFEAPSSSSVWPRVTAHDTVRPDAALVHLHPHATRLVAGNRVDRAPFHAIHLEVGGNFERDDGRGNWWAPEIAGRGRASDGQIAAAREWGVATVAALELLGVRPVAVLPHRVTGRDRNGHPDRAGCCGSRLNSEVVEWIGAELQIPVAAPGWSLGGLAVPDSWHGEHYSRCRATFRDVAR